MFRTGRGTDGKQAAEQLALGLRRACLDARRRTAQWYLHLFDPTQPDLNWRRTEVRQEFESILRFWLDRGARRFPRRRRPRPVQGQGRTARTPARHSTAAFHVRRTATSPRCTTIYRRWNTVLDDVRRRPDGDRRGVGRHADEMARYMRPDELPAGVQLPLARGAVVGGGVPTRRSSGTYAAVGAGRGVADLGAVEPRRRARGDPLRRRGAGARPRRARRTWRCSRCLGRPTSTRARSSGSRGRVPEKDRQDPAFLRGGVARAGRLPGAAALVGDAASLRLQPGRLAAQWLPQPRVWARLSVAAQEAIRSRRCTSSGTRWPSGASGVLRAGQTRCRSWPPSGRAGVRARPRLHLVLNCGKRPYPLGDLGPLIIASDHDDQVSMGVLPA